MISDKIDEIWEKLEDLLPWDEYGEYLRSLEVVATYGNEEENPELYKSILVELEKAYKELYEGQPTELPVYIDFKINLGMKPIGFRRDEAEKELIEMGFDTKKFSWYFKQGY